jgi:hypothetical protein
MSVIGATVVTTRIPPDAEPAVDEQAEPAATTAINAIEPTGIHDFTPAHSTC